MDPLESSAFLLVALGVLIPSISTLVGISAANFWVPLYLLVLGLSPGVSFWLAVFTMIFGYGSASVGFIRRGHVDWSLVRRYAAVSVPGAAIGVWLYPSLSIRSVLAVFAAFTAVYAAIFIRRLVGDLDPPPPHERIRWAAGALGGLLTGLVSVGLGALIRESCVTYGKPPSPERGTGSTVIVVLLTSAMAATARYLSEPELAAALLEDPDRIVHILKWVVPAVVVGGQIGPALVARLPPRTPRMIFAFVLVLVACSMTLRALQA